MRSTTCSISVCIHVHWPRSTPTGFPSVPKNISPKWTASQKMNCIFLLFMFPCKFSNHKKKKENQILDEFEMFYGFGKIPHVVVFRFIFLLLLSLIFFLLFNEDPTVRITIRLNTFHNWTIISRDGNRRKEGKQEKRSLLLWYIRLALGWLYRM